MVTTPNPTRLREPVLRVLALRELARRAGTPEEAAAAAAAAARIVQRFALTEAQLEAEGRLAKEGAEAAADPLVTWLGPVPVWQRMLALGLAQLHSCAAYAIEYQRPRAAGAGVERRSDLHLVGRPSDVAVVRHLYAWLALEIGRLSQADPGRGLRWRNSFRLGATQGVLAAMQAEADAARAEAHAAGASAALALVDARAAEADALKAALLRAPGVTARRKTVHGAGSDRDAFAAGFVAGATQLAPGRKKLPTAT